MGWKRCNQVPDNRSSAPLRVDQRPPDIHTDPDCMVEKECNASVQSMLDPTHLGCHPPAVLPPLPRCPLPSPCRQAPGGSGWTGRQASQMAQGLQTRTSSSGRSAAGSAGTTCSSCTLTTDAGHSCLQSLPCKEASYQQRSTLLLAWPSTVRPEGSKVLPRGHHAPINQNTERLTRPQTHGTPCHAPLL